MSKKTLSVKLDLDIEVIRRVLTLYDGKSHSDEEIIEKYIECEPVNIDLQKHFKEDYFNIVGVFISTMMLERTVKPPKSKFQQRMDEMRRRFG